MFTEANSNGKHTFLLLLQYTVLISVLLYFGKALFIPLSFALLISFLLYPACKWMEKKGVNRVVAISLGLLGVLLFFAALITLLVQQLISFAGEWQAIREKLYELIPRFSDYLFARFNISVEQQEDWLKKFMQDSSLQVLPFLQKTIQSSGVTLVLFCLIPVYSALMLYHRHRLVELLYSLFAKERRTAIHKIIIQVSHTYYSFIKGMLLVYFIVGILNSIGLLIIGIPNPFLFGFLASILTFIPYVGIIIASLLPVTISWITFNSVWYPAGVIAIFSIVQYLEANIIFPFAVSHQLQINSLVTIIAIMVGGILWGVAGMILFVPFLAILKLISDNIEEMGMVSRIIGKE